MLKGVENFIFQPLKVDLRMYRKNGPFFYTVFEKISNVKKNLQQFDFYEIFKLARFWDFGLESVKKKGPFFVYKGKHKGVKKCRNFSNQNLVGRCWKCWAFWPSSVFCRLEP